MPQSELLAGVASCSECGELLEVASASDAPSMMSDEIAAPRTPVPPPPEIAIERGGDGAGYRDKRSEGITILRGSRRRARRPLAFRSLELAVVLGLWTANVVVLELAVPQILVVPVTAVVLLRFFDQLARYNNRIRIVVDDRRLHVSVGPWPSHAVDREVPRDGLRQLFCVSSDRTDVGLGPYQIRALRTGDVSTLLVEGLETPEEALYIEQQLEQALGIPDREVAIELPRKRARGVPKGWHHTRADRGRGLLPMVARAAVAFLVALLPAVAIAIYHDADTLAAIELTDEPQTMIVEVTTSRADVFLAVDIDIDIGDLRPNLPALDAIVAVRKPGAKADRELVCDLTPADDADYYFHRVDNVPQQHVSWFGRVADCPLDLEPGTWEVVVYRRWRDRGPKTDRVEDMKLTIQAKR